MKNVKTEDLKEGLIKTDDLDAFLSQNSDSFDETDAQELLRSLLERSGLSKAELARRSGVSEVYVHQLFSGIRHPSRDRLICLALGMSVTLEEMQELLRRLGHAELYAKEKRDAIIIYGIAHGQTLQELNDNLFDRGAATLI
ncbi:MAG: helix-turn-helix transcriptional regulator [Firmicutes bacterium]|nr:helix-turn-helix transcriptional regulator [Bacillota bacterium]MBQ6295386.1 helix-turn-helix transcriptional regulator [Bacillota bacterium]MBR0516491.1 helix-turn-helix transcriptional regulator [Bacillota bacterium]